MNKESSRWMVLVAVGLVAVAAWLVLRAGEDESGEEVRVSPRQEPDQRERASPGAPQIVFRDGSVGSEWRELVVDLPERYDGGTVSVVKTKRGTEMPVQISDGAEARFLAALWGRMYGLSVSHEKHLAAKITEAREEVFEKARAEFTKVFEVEGKKYQIATGGELQQALLPELWAPYIETKIESLLSDERFEMGSWEQGRMWADEWATSHGHAEQVCFELDEEQYTQMSELSLEEGVEFLRHEQLLMLYWACPELREKLEGE